MACDGVPVVSQLREHGLAMAKRLQDLRQQHRRTLDAQHNRNVNLFLRPDVAQLCKALQVASTPQVAKVRADRPPASLTHCTASVLTSQGIDIRPFERLLTPCIYLVKTEW